MRHILGQARLEAANARPRVKTCINNQNLQLAKILPNNYLNCEGNFSEVMSIRSDILKLKQVSLELVPFCTHLNPFGSTQLKFCLEKKIAELKVQLTSLEHDFTNRVKDLVNISTKCIIEASGRLLREIGSIEGAIRNCKNFSSTSRLFI